VIAILGVIKPCTCRYTRPLRFLIPGRCAYLDSLGEFAFGPKLGFKNKCRACAGFGLQNEARLQLWAAAYKYGLKQHLWQIQCWLRKLC